MMKQRRKYICENRFDHTRWADGWAVVADPVRFATKFNISAPGTHRCVTEDDIRQMEHCGLIGRSGFFSRSDIETVKGILQYERFRERIVQGKPESVNAEIVSV